MPGSYLLELMIIMITSPEPEEGWTGTSKLLVDAGTVTFTTSYPDTWIFG
jgi:hypothetical protein